jgi:hypothetical protein
VGRDGIRRERQIPSETRRTPTGAPSRRGRPLARKIESTTQMYLHHARGVLAYTQDTRSSRLLGYTHTTVTGRTAIQPSFVFYCGTIITYIMDPVLFQV